MIYTARLLTFLLCLVAAFVLATPGAAQSIVPAEWDPALAGDLVLERLVQITAPQVKGAHDAEMVLVQDRAFVVAEVNDIRAGEAAKWPEIYCAMSIVDLTTLKVEQVILACSP